MGAPKGNQNAAKAKVWSAAIERALERRKPANERGIAIDDLADKLLDLCAGGDLQALQELGNRLEGKPAQALEVSGNLGYGYERVPVPVEQRESDALESPAGTAVNGHSSRLN